MFLLSFREDQYIIQIDNTEVVNQTTQSLINIGLECSQGIGKAKGDHQELVVAIASPESCFPFVSYPNVDSVVGVLQVDLTKVGGSSNSVHDFSDQRQRVAILNSDGIKALIVSTHPQSSVLFRCEENRGTSRAFRLSNEPLSQAVFQPFPQGFELLRRQGVDWSIRRFLSRLQLYSQIDVAMGCQFLSILG